MTDPTNYQTVCTATELDADPRRPSEDRERSCGKDAKYHVGIDSDDGGFTSYLCEKHYQEYIQEREGGE